MLRFGERCNATWHFCIAGLRNTIRAQSPMINSEKQSYGCRTALGGERQRTPAATNQDSKRVALFPIILLTTTGSSSALLTMSTGCRASTPESFRPAAFIQIPEGLGPEQSRAIRSGHDHTATKGENIIRVSPAAVLKCIWRQIGVQYDTYSRACKPFTLVQAVNIHSARRALKRRVT